MSQDRPERVRVTGPPRRQVPGSRARAREIDAETPVGSLYVASLVGEQLRLALRTVGVVLVLVGSLPLVFHLAPRLAEHELLGVSVTWLVLGFLVYPLFCFLGWRYIRSAEANERDFSDLVGDPGAGSTP
ncbi:hypothetical protein [Nocardioides taihuensis]|uniref:DUF485 domain-containing protein n=1 Tax=Nocardioides taihuensis TaxID=1835606 RepID=A0ABW0BHV9_9ACTN